MSAHLRLVSKDQQSGKDPSGVEKFTESRWLVRVVWLSMFAVGVSFWCGVAMLISSLVSP
jgi:hypothetical protein